MNLRFVDEHVEGTALVEAMSDEVGCNYACCLIFVSENMALRGTRIEKLQQQNSTCCLIFVSENMALRGTGIEKLQQQNSTCCLIFVSEHMALRGTGILLDLTILPLPTLVPLGNSNYYIIYIYYMKFTAYMAFLFITFFHIPFVKLF